tara:strand:+ start:444 stop:725 length:282 start_codon:yes stop_codon:yes gene_type:complete
MTRYHNINGELIAFTAEEEKAREAEEAASVVEKAATEYIRNRQYEGTKTYPQVTEQLDQLFRDITAGKFGNDAKTGEWYIAIKEVKDANPKPS